MRFFINFILIVCIVLSLSADDSVQKDMINTSIGKLEIIFIGHGSLMFRINDKTIHIDPFNRLADYSKLAKADLILLTHHHGDHLDTEAIKHIRTQKTTLILTERCSQKVANGIIMKNGETHHIDGIIIEAVPAYNMVNRRNNGQLFHPKGEGNGYVLTVGNKRIYIAGDTENTPEMKALQNIDVAFLPMNLPYTMSPEMVADAVHTFRPKILYPYHYGDTDTNRIIELLKNSQETEIRIR